MWTPKRILILIGGLFLFLGGYGIYAYFLGGIDGLPELPDSFAEKGQCVDDPTILVQGGTAEKKLSMAFGQDCKEIQWPIKLDLPSRGWVFATKLFEPENGRVKVSPLSACIFPKGRNDGGFPEINTIQCDEAYLTLDQPVKSTTEMANRKVVSVELRSSGEIKIKNNRRTPHTSDDLELKIAKGPLFYDSRTNQVWTDGEVRLFDMQTRPHPTDINAIGMIVFLSKDSVAPGLAKVDKKPRPRSEGKSDPISGVDKLLLKSMVDMRLSVDGKSGFLGDLQAPGPKKVARLPDEGTPPSPEKALIHIQTPGTFTYDLAKEFAVFDGPPEASGQPGPPQVKIARKYHSGAPKVTDQLDCDHLELTFRRKLVDEHTSRREGKGVEKEIVSAHAKSRPGGQVKVNFETEKLIAHGQELIYVSPTEEIGPQTILRGQPLDARKDGHKIEAIEMHLIGANKAGKGQRAAAKGPGNIFLFDKSNPNVPYPIQATWKDMLTITKVKEGNKLFDLLTLTKEAAIVDIAHRQELQGERLEIMAEPANSGEETPASSARSTPIAKKQRLYKIDAYENVRAFSADFIVKNAQVLQVRFRDKSPEDDRLPDVASTSAKPAATSGGLFGGQAKVARVDQGAPKDNRPPAAPESSPDKVPAKTRPPIEVEARQITAVVSRGTVKDDLDELIMEGNVHVHQEGGKPEEKGIDIKGSHLQLIHNSLGDILYVNGDSRLLAEVLLNDLYMTGPKVTVDQQANSAVITGAGWMNMRTSTTFEGARTASKDARIVVHWKNDMVFDGKKARFKGHVQATQEHACLKCEEMVVTLDRYVSFKEREGRKDAPDHKDGPKVDKIRCEQKVTVVEDVRDAQKNYVKFHGLSSVWLEMDNLDEKAVAGGPGQVLILAPAAANMAAFGPNPGQGKNAMSVPAAQVLKLTRVFYDGMIYNKKVNNQRIAHFHQNVRVLHFPANRPDAGMNPDQPKKDEFYMRSDELIVYTRALPNHKSTQTLNARHNVEFKAENIFCRAQSVTFDESNDVVVLEGKDNIPATLYQSVPNENVRTINARKILYNRKTGAVNVEGGREFGNQ